jgi:acyl carrier protein
VTSDPNDLDALVRRLLGDIAPDMDTAALDPHADVRDALDIDSVDFLNFVVALHESTGVDVPERDYPNIRTVASCAAYVARALGSTA